MGSGGCTGGGTYGRKGTSGWLRLLLPLAQHPPAEEDERDQRQRRAYALLGRPRGLQHLPHLDEPVAHGLRREVQLLAHLLRALAVRAPPLYRLLFTDRVTIPMEEPRERPVGGRARGPQEPHRGRIPHGLLGTVCLHDAEGHAIRVLRYGTMPDGDPAQLCEGLADDVLAFVASASPSADAPLRRRARDVEPARRAFDRETFDGAPMHGLVDFWHTVEKLAAAAKVIEPKDADRLRMRWKLPLLNASAARARSSTSSRPRTPSMSWSAMNSKPVHDAITYLVNNAGRMDYARARKLGLPIGSGNVEATCKSLVNLRMNRSGSRWKIDTGEHILQLRALALSDRWDAAMDLTLRPKRAIRRAA